VFVLTVALQFLLSARHPARPRADYLQTPRSALHAQMDLTPWRHTRLAAIIISLLTLAFYIGLAQ